MMKAGTTFYLATKLGVDKELISSLIFTVKSKNISLTKENGYFHDDEYRIPFTQEETLHLVGKCLIEGQINFKNGSVAKTEMKSFYVFETLATKIMKDNVALNEGKQLSLNILGELLYVDDIFAPMVGATGNTPGVSGLVPTPNAGDNKKYLRGDGTWGDEVSQIAKSIANLPKSSDDEIKMLIEADLLPAVHDASGAILTDGKGNIILRY